MNKDLLFEIINTNEEREWIEFKNNFPADKYSQEIGEYISALSNSAALHEQPFAYLIWGIENDTKEIIGTSFEYDLDINGSEVFKHYLTRNLSPRIFFEFEEIILSNKRIVVLTIPSAKGTITEFKQDRFIRIGSSKELLRKFPNHEAKLWNILNNNKWELTSVLSPRQDLTFKTFHIYLDDFGIDYTKDNITKNNYMLLSSGEYNYLAYMFSDQFDMSFKIVKFSGENKQSDYIFRKEFGNCCVLKAIDNVLNYMDNTENLVRSYFDGSSSRRDEFLFDKKAFREAYINAVLHNDWSRKTAPSVFLFSNHLEIYNYGSPLNVQSKESFLKGNSVPINAELAKVFMKFDKYEES